ncbi:MAG: hypothetical protein DHS20C17_12050 [Cyclobacteriaceae bacterium]|nr:MAG: hypothetical protein DHS20C17_12050 [Cyclobacteriaceae bacterium]
MKRLFCTILGGLLSVFVFAQHVLQDEALQAQVHYMNAAKVSYVASAEVYQSVSDPDDEPEIPGEIRESFKLKYKGARKVEWAIKEDRYKVNFLLDGNDMFAYLDRHGDWMKSFTKLDLEKLPEQVVGFLETEYPDYQLTKIYLKETPYSQSYTIAVKGDQEYVWLEFNENGILLSNPA